MNGLQVAVLPGRVGSRATAAPTRGEREEHPAVRTMAFFFLGLFGVIRWATLLGGQSSARLVGMLCCTGLLVAVGPVLAARRRLLALPLAIVVTVVTLTAAGLPLSWIVHLRLGVCANTIGEGLSALPGTTVPYTGVNEWVRMTILLGAAVLLLDAALVLTFVPRSRGLLRRAGAALPLLALAAIPATLLRPALAYPDGLVLFGLLVVFMWGERIRAGRLGAVLVPCLLAGALAVTVAPSLERHHAWINYRALAQGFAPAGVETFDWSQGYGALVWPHTGHTVAEIQAAHPDYWKVENLDEFNGHGWAAAVNQPDVAWQAGVSRRSLTRWTQTLQVTLRLIDTSKVIAAGSAYRPTQLEQGVEPGYDPGTWQSADRMGPGDSYRVRVYAPHPSTAQLRAAGVSYPSPITGTYLSVLVPEPGLPSNAGGPGPTPLVNVDLPPFGSAQAAELGRAGPIASAFRASPYERAFALARHLTAGAASPYAYAQRIESYLDHGFRYSLHPRQSAYPIETFLFSSKLGYCQHFAGAMALLLRMGGVPARVAVGFTRGSYDQSTHSWVVSDVDAHAWVEAWFPHYGWVRFDPTPGADPALRSEQPTAAGLPGTAGKRSPLGLHHRDSGPAPSPGPSHRSGPAHGSSGATALLIIPSLLVALLLGGALLTRARGAQDGVAELARAYARAGRPLSRPSTLAGLECRLAPDWPQAAAYVRSLRLSRFSSGPQTPSLRQRRALRAPLRDGLGVTGRARALWALPPRWSWPRRLPGR
jgi:transglutaminase-like putative cysteine protease